MLTALTALIALQVGAIIAGSSNILPASGSTVVSITTAGGNYANVTLLVPAYRRGTLRPAHHPR